MEKYVMHRTMYKNARFEVETRTERSRRLTVHNQKENRDRQHFLRRNVVIEPTPPQPVVKETRKEKLLKWKAKKEALLLAQKATKKPPFKVGAFQCSTIKDVTNIPPPPKSTIKSTIKKAVNQTLREPKKPTAASTALAALCVLPDARRITRSQARLVEQAQQVNNKSSTMSKYAPKTDNKASGLQKPNNQASFAPANHIFRPPINLTFPVTPDLMKRKSERKERQTPSQPKKTLDWPTISGVKLLTPSSSLANLSIMEGLPLKKVEDNKPSVEEGKVTQRKRRSARLATPKSAVGVCEDNVKNRAIVKEAEDKTEEAEDKENMDDEENRVVARKIARMSIHSPTQKDPILTPPSSTQEIIPAQFSPFIVTGRGADRHKHRRSRGNDFEKSIKDDEDIKRAEQVQSFRSILDAETKRILDMCDKWDSVKNSADKDIPSDVQDMILCAVGQARLLTKDKFQQFKRLVDKFEEGTSQEEKILADDLSGFWEMVQLTVNGLDDRFKKLSDLQANNWKEEVKVVRENPSTLVAPRVRKVNPEILKESKARIREAIAAARKMRQEKMEKSRREHDKTFDGGFFKVQSPNRNTEINEPRNGPRTPKPNRKSLLQQVLSNSANRAARSPSVSDVGKMMRASMIGRRVSLSRPVEEQSLISPLPALNAIPAKSILKSVKSSAKRRTVMFTEATASKKDSDKDDTTRLPPRRSLRFSSCTKFDDSAS